MGPAGTCWGSEISSTDWLTFLRRAMLSQLCHLFKARIGLAPSYLSNDFCPMQHVHNNNTRGSDLNYFVDTQKFPPGTLHHTVVREWNKLPQSHCQRECQRESERECQRESVKERVSKRECQREFQRDSVLVISDYFLP